MSDSSRSTRSASSARRRGAPRALVEPEGAPARYSSAALPPYRHVPGLTPHPVKDPRGHLYGQEDFVPSTCCSQLPERWSECREYLYGVDLFNRAYLWEAHEVWELVWIASGKVTAPACFIQGLIQVAAALLRSHLGTPGGASNLLSRAEGNLDSVVNLSVGLGAVYMGLDLSSWTRAARDYVLRGVGTYPFIALQKR